MTERETSPDFWRGVLWAVTQVENEAHDLAEIRLGYIEAQRTGMHGDRRISEKQSREFARQFHERSEAVFMTADHLSSLVPPSPARPEGKE